MERLYKLNDRLSAVLASPRSYLVFGTLFLAYIVVGVAFIESVGESDYWEHLAAIASFSRNPFHPANPYLLSSSPTHLLTPYHFFWGLLARTLSISPFHVLPIAAGVNVILFLVGIRAFCARILGDAKWSLPLALAMLLWWIRGWPWSGFYFFGLFPTASVYPFFFALSLSLYLISALDLKAGFRNIGLCALAGALVFLVHPITGGFLFLALLSKALFAQPAGVSRFLVFVATFGVVLAAAIVAWPFFPVLESILRVPSYSSVSFAGDWRMFYDKALLRIGPSLVGAFWLVRHWRDERTRFLTAGWMACTFIYLANYGVLHSAALSRLVIFVALFGHFGLAAGLSSPRPEKRGSLAMLGFLAASLALAVPQVALSAKEIAPLQDLRQGVPFGTHANATLVAHLERIGRKVEPGSVVMAPLQESWFLPGVLDCRVVGVFHSNPFFDDFEERQKATLDFFDPAKSDALRWEIIERYQVRYVLAPVGAESALATLKPNLEFLAEEARLRLYRVNARRDGGSHDPAAESQRE